MAEKLSQEYPLAQTRREAERLHKQHVWQQACLNNQIVFAPVDTQRPGLRVLDVGCADGSLLRDLRKVVSPSAELVGIDITAAFLPTSPEGNIRYAAGNVCDPPTENLLGAFDFTHLRYVLVGCGKVSIDLPISNLVATLAPGGWLQVQELDVTLYGTEQRSAFADLNRILGTIWDKTGPGAAVVHDIEEAFVRAGLLNVTVQRLQLPVGKKMSSEYDRELSLEPFKLSIPNIKQGAKSLGTDLPTTVFDNLEARFEQEMLEHGANFSSVLVYGQKPT